IWLDSDLQMSDFAFCTGSNLEFYRYKCNIGTKSTNTACCGRLLPEVVPRSKDARRYTDDHGAPACGSDPPVGTGVWARNAFGLKHWRLKMNATKWVRTVAVLSLFAAGSASAMEMGGPLADHVRAANERFKDVSAAIAEGYGPIACASGYDGGS